MASEPWVSIHHVCLILAGAVRILIAIVTLAHKLLGTCIPRNASNNILEEAG
jgi:hypothetical protein